MDAMAEFANWAADLSAADIPDDVLRLARAEIANTAAAGLDGHLGAAGDRTELLRRHAGDGPCSAFGAEGLDPASACFVNATCSMVHDFDDFLFMGHSDHSAVFAALAVAELDDRTLDELAVSVVVANELEGRLGTAAAIGPHNGQMWTFIHQAGAAAIVARTLDGTPSTIRDATSAALYQIPWPTARGFMQGEAKLSTAAAPTAAGVRLGLFAASGGRGAEAAALGEGGALDSYVDLPLGEMLDGWGESWVTRSLSFKPRPGCAYLQSVLENYRELGGDDLEPDHVESIRVRASLPTVMMERLSAAYRSEEETNAEFSTVNATFSVRLGLAIALLGEGLDRETLSPAWIDRRRDAIETLADRISIAHDWDHTAALIEGVAAGIDLHALADGRSTFTWLGALRNVRNHHDYASFPADLGTVPNLAQLRDLVDSVGADWDVDEFDFGLADFEKMRFDFGSTVEIETADGTETAERRGFPGACRESVDDRVDLVRDKCTRVAADIDGEVATDDFLDALFTDGDAEALATLGDWIAGAER